MRDAGRLATAAITILLAGPVAAQADVNARQPDGSTPLQWAVYEQDLEEVRSLIAAGADVSIGNNYGATPMSLAAEAGHTDIIRMLLAAGADPDSPNADQQTALMTVARTGNTDAARLLIDAGADVDARESWGGQTALMWAAARRHPQMIELLLASGANIEARSAHRDYQRHVTAEGRPKNLDTGGFTPLLYTARENCRACVNVLLEHGADIDNPDPDGVSPLLLAVMNANWDLAIDLIEAGADVDQWNIYGEAPLFTAVRLRDRADGGRASIDPVNTHDGLSVIEALLREGADPNMQLFFKPSNVRGSTNTRGATPLIAAANRGDFELVQLLLRHGADATLYMADRQTPIHAALAGRSNEEDTLQILRALHEAGTDPNVIALVNHRQEIRGGTALHYAVRRRFLTVIEELIAWGTDPNARDQDGLSALDYAQSRGFMPFMALQTPYFHEEVQLLRSMGATAELPEDPVWPVLGPPQGVWPDIWPLGETRIHAPIYTHSVED